jgi:hypothetical protein
VYSTYQIKQWHTTQEYLSKFWGPDVTHSIERLSRFHNVKITYDNQKPIHELEEVGTDGVIDHIAVKLP